MSTKGAYIESNVCATRGGGYQKAYFEGYPKNLPGQNRNKRAYQGTQENSSVYQRYEDILHQSTHPPLLFHWATHYAVGRSSAG